MTTMLATVLHGASARSPAGVGSSWIPKARSRYAAMRMAASHTAAGHPRAEPRELQLEDEVLRGLDPEASRELGDRRGSRLGHRGVILIHREDVWLPRSCGPWRWERSSMPRSRCCDDTLPSSSGSPSCARACQRP